jgi:hypothetical protein
MEIAKIGDIIEYTFDKRDWEVISEKTFRQEVLMVDMIDNCYGVCAPYGQDLIPFNEATIINETTSPPKEASTS